MPVDGDAKIAINRIGIYHFYDHEGYVDDYIVYNLKELKTVCNILIFTVNGEIDTGSRSRIESLGIEVIVRPNEGYDFGAWKDAIMKKWDIVADADELILSNDSYYGPVYSWSEVFSEMSARDCDFWGLTNRDCYKGMEGSTPEHIQSYFLVVRRKMLSSADFKDYWEKLEYAATFKECVDNCEGRFTDYFSKLGYTWGVYCSIPEGLGLKNGSFEYDTDELVITCGLPIIKKKFFTSIDGRIKLAEGEAVLRLFQYIDSCTDYDKGLILENIIRTCKLSDISEIIPNYITITGNECEIDRKAAIFFHIGSTADLRFYSEYIDNVPPGVDVFMVITDSQSEGMSKDIIARDHCVISTVGDNIERIHSSVLAKMKEYEFVCIIRDSETVSNRYYGIDNYTSKKSLRYCVWHNLVGNAEQISNIVRVMSVNSYIGLLYPPCPDHDDYRVIDEEKWNDIANKTRKIIGEYGIDDKMIDESSEIFPLSFWCRVDSIMGITDDIPIQLFPLICQKNGYLPYVSVSASYASLKMRNNNSIVNTIDRMEKEKVIKFLLKHNYVFRLLKKLLR